MTDINELMGSPFVRVKVIMIRQRALLLQQQQQQQLCSALLCFAHLLGCPHG